MYVCIYNGFYSAVDRLYVRQRVGPAAADDVVGDILVRLVLHGT